MSTRQIEECFEIEWLEAEKARVLDCPMYIIDPLAFDLGELKDLRPGKIIRISNNNWEAIKWPTTIAQN